MWDHRKLFHVGRAYEDKAKQIEELMSVIAIKPVANSSFFYSLDCFKTVPLKKQILDNCSVNYEHIINGSFKDYVEKLSGDDAFSCSERHTIAAMKHYLDRCKNDPNISHSFARQMTAIESIFSRPAESLFEGLQRILFLNQILWQTRHKNNGLGHLDWILENLYKKGIEDGSLTRDMAKDFLRDFFFALHEYYWFKSQLLIGDTGQIIVLGGQNQDEKYQSNELTYLFIEVAAELKLPDPKVLLRCSTSMPDDLLKQALKCIATGIGAPLLSNDDSVIPALVDYGYTKAEACSYVTSACWEPLILDCSCDQNNIMSLNFAEPFVAMSDDDVFDKFDTMDAIFQEYERCLKTYMEKVLSGLTGLVFEEDPLLSLLTDIAVERRSDITKGKIHNNLGLTSVGMGTVVNSLLNIKHFVFDSKEYTLKQLNDIRKNNYKDHDKLCGKLKNPDTFFGCNEAETIQITQRIMRIAGETLDEFRTKSGGRFKFGLSSPSYIDAARCTAATFDGRKNGEPFSVHISANAALPLTELLLFAMKLDYKGSHLNGNVVDCIIAPSVLRENIDKYSLLLKEAFRGGIYQFQMNVVDSKTLIAAKADPALFPNLIVRVWGFSSYFNDLPEEYKDLLISRVLESEKAA